MGMPIIIMAMMGYQAGLIGMRSLVANLARW